MAQTDNTHLNMPNVRHVYMSFNTGFFSRLFIVDRILVDQRSHKDQYMLNRVAIICSPILLIVQSIDI